MVTEDYGKRAYLKLNSLEKRIEKLENFAMQSVYSELFYDLSGVDKNKNFKKSFKVNSLKNGVYSISGNLETSLSTLFLVDMYVYVNGVVAYTVKSRLTKKHSFNFEASFNEGINEIVVEISSGEITVLEVLNFKLSGNVSYVNSVNSLSHYYYNNVDYVLHLKDNTASLYRYYTSILHNTLTFNDLKECSIISVNDIFLYILAITINDELKIIKVDLENKTYTENSLNVVGVTSACGYKNGNNFIIYFSKLSKIYKGSCSLSFSFNYISTGKTGVKLYTDNTSNGSMIVVDKYSNAKLVTD